MDGPKERGIILVGKLGILTSLIIAIVIWTDLSSSTSQYDDVSTAAKLNAVSISGLVPLLLSFLVLAAGLALSAEKPPANDMTP